MSKKNNNKMINNFFKLSSSCLPLLLVACLFLFMCSMCHATNYSSYHQYIFSTTYNQNYEYLWSASSGEYSENNKNTFVWTAPRENSPTEVTISVLVSDNGPCACKASDSIEITVIPSANNGLGTNSTNSSTNYSIFNEVIRQPQIFSLIITNNSTSLIPSGNLNDCNPLFDSKENATITDNLTLRIAESIAELSIEDVFQNETTMMGALNSSKSTGYQDPISNSQGNLSFADFTLDSQANIEIAMNNMTKESEISFNANANLSPVSADPAKESVDQANKAPTTETPLTTDARKDAAIQDYQNTAKETCTLSFGDGLDINVVFEQSSSLADTTYVVLEGAIEKLIKGNSPLDGTNNPLSSTNAASMPDSGMDQTGSSTNQTQTANAMPELEATIGPSSIDVSPDATGLPEQNKIHPDPAINQTNAE